MALRSDCNDFWGLRVRPLRTRRRAARKREEF